MKLPLMPVRVLTIAGSDCSGGAGIQADLKTFQALGCYGMSVLTALTAQNTLKVSSVFAVSPGFIEDQMAMVFEDVGVDAVKIGMLHGTPVIESVARILKRYEVSKVVLDPVMISKAGSSLLDPQSVEAMVSLLFPLTSILTPNLPEAEVITGQPFRSCREMEEGAEVFLKSVPAVILKGGHLVDRFYSPDFLATVKGERKWLKLPRIDSPNTHGTGCTYSSAIAAYLGKGADILEAVALAREFLQSAILSGKKYSLGRGCGPVDHSFLQGSR